MQSKGQSYNQLNFFLKPTFSEFFKKVEKEQKQMEGYLGENWDDAASPKQ